MIVAKITDEERARAIRELEKRWLEKKTGLLLKDQRDKIHPQPASESNRSNSLGGQRWHLHNK